MKILIITALLLILVFNTYMSIRQILNSQKPNGDIDSDEFGIAVVFLFLFDILLCGGLYAILLDYHEL